MISHMLATAILAATGAGAPAAASPAIYSNMEEVYFDEEAGQDPAPWLSVRVTGDKVEFLDEYGNPVPAPTGWSVYARDDREFKILLKGDGRTIADQVTTLRRARPVSCWAGVRKDTPKADGTLDWFFYRELKMHDQGGRIKVGGGDTGAPPAIIRMRNVTWPEGSSNRPSLVLYIDRQEDPGNAVSYSWTNAQSSRIGINLRWIQASCTIDDAEGASQISSSNFRG